MKIATFFFVVLFFNFHTAFSEEANQKNSAVLDFEGDVIEGERKRPYMFIQTGTEAKSLDGLLFFRSDFNDYHEIDKNKRPSFIPSKKQRK